MTATHDWSAPLSRLMPALERELEAKRPGTWAWRALRGGALVALQRRTDGRRVLRIARRERPATPDGFRRWGIEVSTFLKHLGAEHWASMAAEETDGIAALFVEPGAVTAAPVADAPATVPCADCGAAVVPEPVWGVQRCSGCVHRVSEEEAEEIQQRAAARATANAH